MCGTITLVTIQSTPAGPSVQVALPENPSPSVVREARDIAVETYRQALLIEQAAAQAAGVIQPRV